MDRPETDRPPDTPAEAAVRDGHPVASRFGVPRGWVVSVSLLALAATAAVMLEVRARARPPAPALMVELTLPAGHSLARNLAAPPFAISADGQWRAMVLDASNTVWVRRRDEQEFRLVAGSDGTLAVALSPDGGQVATISAHADRNRLMLFDVASGGSRLVTDSLVGTDGLSWGSDGFLYLEDLTGQGTAGLSRLRPDGSGRESLTQVDRARGEDEHILPVSLPSGRALLFTVVRKAERSVAMLDLATRTVTTLTVGSGAGFVAPNVLLYDVPGRGLLAARFDEGSGQLEGAAFTINAATDGAATGFAANARGMVIFAPSAFTSQQTGVPVWVDLTGRATLVDSTLRGDTYSAQIAPDGRRVVFGRIDLPRSRPEIAIKQLPGGVPQRLSLNEVVGSAPTWSADGRSILFIGRPTIPTVPDAQIAAARPEPVAYTVSATGEGSARPLFPLPGTIGIDAWREWLFATAEDLTSALSPSDGRTFGLRSNGGAGDAVRAPMFDEEANHYSPRVSPDGRWLAYVSDVREQAAILVRPFPVTGEGRWLMTETGVQSPPLWSADGQTLYYVGAVGKVMAADLAFAAGGVQVTSRRELFSAAPFHTVPNIHTWDITADGRRFLMLRRSAAAEPPRVFVIENLSAFLRTKARGAAR